MPHVAEHDCLCGGEGGRRLHRGGRRRKQRVGLSVVATAPTIVIVPSVTTYETMTYDYPFNKTMLKSSLTYGSEYELPVELLLRLLGRPGRGVGPVGLGDGLGNVRPVTKAELLNIVE